MTTSIATANGDVRSPLGREPATAASGSLLGDAVREHPARSWRATRAQVRQRFRTGRIGVAIGVAFLAPAIVAGERLAGLVDASGAGATAP